MKPILGYAVQRWSERLSDAHLAWAVRAIVAIAAGGVPHTPCPEGLERAWEEIEEEQVAMLRAYNAKVKRLADAGRKGGQRKAENRRLANATNPASEEDAVANARSEGSAPARVSASASARPPAQKVFSTKNTSNIENLGNEARHTPENGSGSTVSRTRAHTHANATADPDSPAAAAIPVPPPTAPARRIRDYLQIFDLSVTAEEVAVSVTGEPFTDFAANTYARYARALGEIKFRQIVASVWGERKDGELRSVENLAAVLVARLKNAMPPHGIR